MHPVHSQGQERSSLHTPRPVRAGLTGESEASSGQFPRLQNHSRSGVTGWPLLVLASPLRVGVTLSQSGILPPAFTSSHAGSRPDWQ